MNKAVDEVRAAESRKMAKDGYLPLLKESGWCVLKRKENLTAQQKFRLARSAPDAGLSVLRQPCAVLRNG
jgi:hypothetical protein